MENLKRNFTYRNRNNGGKDVPNFSIFFYVKYFCFKMIGSGGIFSYLLGNAAGMVLKCGAEIP